MCLHVRPLPLADTLFPCQVLRPMHAEGEGEEEGAFSGLLLAVTRRHVRALATRFRDWAVKGSGRQTGEAPVHAMH